MMGTHGHTPEVGYVVGRTTVSNGRTWWVSKISGVGWSRDRSKARVFPERSHAERWAAMEQNDIDRGIGGQRVFVTTDTHPETRNTPAAGEGGGI